MSYLPILTTPRIDVSSADLLSIVSSPKTLLPAQGANTIVNVLSFIMDFTSGTAYTYASNLFLTMGANTLFNLGNPLTGSSIIKSAGGQSATLTANTAVTLSGGGTDPTTGTGTMKIKLFYTIEQLYQIPGGGTFTSSFNTTINTSDTYDLDTVIDKDAPGTSPFTYSINTAPSGTSITGNTLTTGASTGSLIVDIVDTDGRTSTATTTVDSGGGGGNIEFRITSSSLGSFNPATTSSLVGAIAGSLLGDFTASSSVIDGNTLKIGDYSGPALASQVITAGGNINGGGAWSSSGTNTYNGSDTIFTINVAYED